MFGQRDTKLCKDDDVLMLTLAVRRRVASVSLMFVFQ